MDTEMILIGAGIYGIILATGFLALSTVREKKADVANDLVTRMMKTVDDGMKTGSFSQQLNAGDVRMLSKAAGNAEKYKAFPFMNDPRWYHEGPETEKLAGTGKKTELLIDGASENNDVLPGTDKKTELLHSGTGKNTEILRTGTDENTEILRTVVGDNTEVLHPGMEETELL